MTKIILSLNKITEKIHLAIYQLTIPFILFFTFILKGASGHQFNISNEEKIYSFILFSAFTLSVFYKESEKFSKLFNEVILYLFLIFSTSTFGLALYFLYFTFTFNYGFWENPIIITFTGFLIPIFFTWCNFYLIRKIFYKLKK